MAFKEKLFEGKYIYTAKGKEYSQEDFSVLREDKLQGNFFYQAEVLSRMSTGEFLRIDVKAEFSNEFEPLEYSIVRSLGAKESQETFSINQKNKLVSYLFEGSGDTNRFEKIVNSKPHIASPCFSMSTVMINAKRLDPVQRTPYTVITSDNVWTYQGPFTEEDVFIEFQDIEQVPLEIQGKELNASRCKVLRLDKKGRVQPDFQEVYLSKHQNIPYKAVFPNEIEIVIDHLRSFEDSKVRF